MSQSQDGTEKVIAYLTKTMKWHERSYCVIRKELLAIVTALRKFHPYLYDQQVLLRIDNAAVSWIKNLKNPTGQMTRWLQEIETYDRKVTHRPGQKRQNALSRNPCKPCLIQTQNSDELDSEGSDTEDQIREESLNTVRPRCSSIGI